MLLLILLLWAAALTLELIYSWAYSYRDAADQPFKFKQVMLGLRVIEKLIFIVVLVILLGEKFYSVAVPVFIVGIFGPAKVSNRTYWAEVRRRAESQAKANKIELSTAMNIAQRMLDDEIKEGWVFF